MVKAFDNLNEEQLAVIRARIQKSIDDPRPSLSLDESRADLKQHIAARTKSVS
jgi:hypothetical protein